MTKRRKAEKLPAATSINEAADLLARYAVLDAELAARKASVDAAIAQLRAESATLDAAAEAEMKTIFLALKPWWAVNADSVTGGTRKSWELAGCIIGHRMTTPKLEYPKPEAVAIEFLQQLGYQGLLRVKTELDKPAIIKLLTGNFDGGDGDALLRDDQNQLAGAGFAVSQKEEFFIDRIPPKEPAVEIVADPQATQVAA